jgi:hypothetical protein
MRTLYDVFTAIQADECDHVSAMKVCLDPNVALISPSIEKRLLTAVALSSAVAFALSVGPLDPSDLTTFDAAATEGSGLLNLLEGVVAGGATLASQLLQGGSEVSVEGIIETAEGVEATSAIGAGTITSEIAGVVAGIIGVLASRLSKDDEREGKDIEATMDSDDQYD